MRIVLIFLLPLRLLADTYSGGEPPPQTLSGLPPGVRIIRYEIWGEPGQGSLLGQIVPEGEVWKVRAAGIVTDDGHYLEWMMQIYYPWPLHLPSPQLVTPLTRYPGTAGGTPVLAVDREILLLPGETLSARVNGITPTGRMGIRFSGWAFPETMLPKLLGIE